MSAGGGQSKIVKSVSLHGFLYTTRANTSHEVAEQIRVCKNPRPHIREWRACMKSVRRHSQGAERALAKRERAQSKVEQTTRALEPALLPLLAVGRFTRYVRTRGYMMFALWQSGKEQGDF